MIFENAGLDNQEDERKRKHVAEIEIKQFSVVAGIGGPLIDKRRVISEGFLVFKRKDDTKTIGRTLGFQPVSIRFPTSNPQ